MDRKSNIRVVSWLALCAYYLAVVLLHEQVQQALMPLFHRWSFVGYELRLVVAWFLLGTPVAILVTVGIFRAWGWRGLGTWAALVVGICIMDHWFLFSQSERIHYVQYALLYLGLRHLLLAPLPALAVATVLGVGDEAYQAYVLYVDRPNISLDFKDILLNFLGALAGLYAHASLAGLRKKAPAESPGGRGSS